MSVYENEPRLPAFIRLILRLIFGWLISLIRFFLAWLKKWRDQWRKRETKWPKPCHTYPSDLWVRPDVYIYSQKWLLSQGIAVTWNNPDIQLREGGVVVDSYHLKPNTEYDLVANIHNRSISSPAIGVRVFFSLRSFGIGGSFTNIGETTVDVSVLGGTLNPAVAQIKWVSPPTAGHYCINVRIESPDDINLDDNEGQENTNVIEATPGDPNLKIPVHNETDNEQKIFLKIDTYNLPEKPLPPGLPNYGHISNSRLKFHLSHHWFFAKKDPNFLAKQLTALRTWKQQRHLEVVKTNAVENFPPNEEFEVSIDEEITIPPRSNVEVPFSFKIPIDAKIGQEYIFNITGLEESGAAYGGVTFIAKVI